MHNVELPILNVVLPGLGLKSPALVSPNSVLTLKGSYGKCKGPVLDRGVRSDWGVFRGIYVQSWLGTKNLEAHFDCAGSCKVVG